MKNKFLALLLFPCLLPTGCMNQQTAAALLTVAGGAIGSLETIGGHTGAATKVQTDFDAASKAVLNWKSGTPTQDVAQALQLVQDDLKLLPVNQKTRAYVDLAIVTVDAILARFPDKTSPGAVAAHNNRAAVPHRAVKLRKTPKTDAEFKAEWNKLVAAQPDAGIPALK